MEETYLINHPGVRKKILAGGTGPLPHFPPGTKLVFHFQTLLDDFERTVVDDSRLAGRPAEIFVGKMFKMEVWETLLMSMRVGEVAEFWCDAVHTGLYPIVSKGMRLIAQGKDPLEGQKHMCGMGNLFHYHSTGFPELDELMKTPQPLIFIMELVQVGDPMSYHRESWMMEKDEKLRTVPLLHMQGNALVKQRKFREAASRYKEAVLLLKTVQSREMPGDIDYINLGRMIIPLELNYCQCMLELEEYYEVIEHTDELLHKHKDCVKGYYKRAKAHAAVWNEKEARRDFNMVASLDVTLASLVGRELRALSERMKEKYWEEKEAYWNMLEKTQDKEAEDQGSGGDGTKEQGGEENQEISEGGELSPGAAGDHEEACSATISPSASSGSEGKDWQQMLRLIMLLQDEGNFLIKEKRFQEASAKFTEALEYVDALRKLVDRESEDLESLEKVCLPLTLNLSQCLLELQQHQRVVELNDKLLKKHKGSFKATYQRARAHAALCNEEEARRDFDLVGKLDPKFKPFIRQELKKLGESMRVVHARQKKTYWDTTQEKWGAGGSEVKGAERKKEWSERKREAVQTTSDSKAAQKAEKSECKMDEKSESEQEKEAEKSECKMDEKSESEQGKEAENSESDADQKEEKSESEMDKRSESEQEKEAEKGESEADKKAGKSESEMDEKTGRSETTEG
ncbi:uncharacterized protein LOC130530900 [Takifugu flavidus]|uniref:Aryl-hydrocarbon-interacting protein-like 1 n=1 Tax=Takifugu flavidus TaxID=433684 RepID=A0A5C6MKP9_9TELE|nr:uncharacterized protein LOC130530900 [Takifugu flavidus]TWW55764.1 Aryl-hydrocarbon-interacting protein-like 1 [Takifugu flavidus]